LKILALSHSSKLNDSNEDADHTIIKNFNTLQIEALVLVSTSHLFARK